MEVRGKTLKEDPRTWKVSLADERRVKIWGNRHWGKTAIRFPKVAWETLMLGSRGQSHHVGPPSILRRSI